MIFLKRILTLIFFPGLFLSSANAQVFYPSQKPVGVAEATVNRKSDVISLKNNVISARFFLKNRNVQKAVLTDEQTHQSVTFTGNELFNMVLQDKTLLKGNDFQTDLLQDTPSNIPLPENSLRAIDRLPGKQISLMAENKDKGISIKWTISLHDSCNFIQQEFYIQQNNPKDTITGLQLVNVPAQFRPRASGVVDGLPVLVNNMFLGIEHPMSYTDSAKSGITDNLNLSVAMKYKNGRRISIVWGVTPHDQLRRGFLYYIEKIRAVPYRPFLHYNSWYDLSWVDIHIHRKDCMDRVKMYLDSLVIKRKVHLKAFLWDDGWDNPNELWHFNPDLPNGFKPLEKLSHPYHANMGVWLSPWGGYGDSQQQRIKSSRTITPLLGINEHGFSLADKNYFNFFKNTAVNLIENQGVCIFKFDGVGAGNNASGATQAYQNDIEGLLRVIKSLREVKPDLYFSITVGTWPSPYWLQYGDNIWRSGGDFGKTGEGNARQQWLNYRDGQVYKNIVLRSPLYPLNALMSHGIAIAGNGYVEDLPKDYQSLSDGIWSFFGNGTSLQELYVNPHMLTSKDWDLLAKAIHWSHAHKGILADVHWVGGDPKDEIYGYAAWNPRGGTLMLRNPANETKEFSFTLKQVLELPEKFNGEYHLYNVVTDKDEGRYNSEKVINFTLQPQEVQVLDITK